MSNAELRAKALKLLSAREHSRFELRRKLSSTQNEADIDCLLDELEAKGWLSDTRFAAAFVRAKAGRMGRMRLRAELRQRGVDDDAVAEALKQLTDGADDETTRARAAWQKRFRGEMPANASERAKQARFLQMRGFDYYTIRRVLNEVDE